MNALPRFISASLLFALATPALAHDFWMEIDATDAPASTQTHVATFRIGNAAKPEPWRLRAERVVALRSSGPDGGVDQQAGILAGEPGRARLHLKGKGTHIVTFETTPSESDLPAAEFNAYLDEEQLSALREWRQAHGQDQARGRELYARRAKTLVQIGEPHSHAVTKPVGLTLEIVPERHPAVLGEGAPLPLRLYFRGQPLAGATIKAERMQAPHQTQSIKTGADGRARVALTGAGRWKITATWSVPITGNPRADFDTQFASLICDLRARPVK